MNKPPLKNTTAVILAAGLGTRMKSSRPKAAHTLAGKTMLEHLLHSASQVYENIIVVLGPEMDELARLAAPYRVVIQQERKGTAHAALQAAPFFGEGDVTILYADNPLISAETMRNLMVVRQNSTVSVALLAMRPKEPGHYGRVIERDGFVERIVEWQDATAEERAITLCNAGVLSASAKKLANWLGRVENHNAKGEYYLGDVISLAVKDGEQVKSVEAPAEELQGINSGSELAQAEHYLQKRLRQVALARGVRLIAPDTVFLCSDTELAEGVIIHPYVVFEPGVVVHRDVEIKSFSHLANCIIHSQAIIGPYARIRPESEVGEGAHIGNFVEIKSARIAEKTKINHLSYIGNANIGSGTNIGAGTILCNYDGYSKHTTIIGNNVFVGSDSVMVAPVSVGDSAIIAAGSVITHNVEKGAMAFGRARQTNIQNRATDFRNKKSILKKEGTP
ncbi:bifunctional UDP-N-acetylglucosamine diphosphorylase/glucosamine-1-phosphate N-acetyltransferase GlmU [Entomobacter blattae]|uniref:Bifunctional protein GlmU n=1 Tax=Entomobacter blattae TaxID=2762277 RepID=A0A7H1NT01_9PROT|nr:bifunctional UDP-N-acetylglucosamine diphosphorylase/glucosamine-1-phosphate N-acetyltransferase GlmU [Entomobacter blattae]QNT78911.1 Bifunctional protein GlmU [Entomobacter blattae]